MRTSSKISSSYDGLGISILETHESTSPKGVIMFIHGLCGRKERQLPAMDYFTGKGYICVGFDLRGHGDSVWKEDDRGYLYQARTEGMTQDIESVMEWIRKQYRNIPVFIVAHSLGSLAARTYIKRNDIGIDGLILCGSPSNNPLSRIGIWIMKAICLTGHSRARTGMLQNLVSAGYNRRFRREGWQAWTCSDPEIRDMFENDQKCNIAITADCSLTLLELMAETYDKEGWKITNHELPILFISGAEDPCMISMKRFHRSVGFMNTVGYNNVSSIIYPGMRHEVLNEKGKEAIWDEMLAFLQNI